jgi:hypothetical protein
MIVRRDFLMLSLAAGIGAFAVAPAATHGAWTTLLDGKSLDGWDQVGDANWRIEDGAAVADKGNGFLLSKATYKDYQLRAEFWYSEEANCGIYVRSNNDKTIDTKSAYEINLWDTRPEKDYATGAVVGIAKVDPMPKAAGKWSTFDITMKGNTFTVILNGQKTVDNVADPKSMFMDGKIALQHGLGNKDAAGVVNDRGVVKFRKVEIRPL